MLFFSPKDKRPGNGVSGGAKRKGDAKRIIIEPNESGFRRLLVSQLLSFDEDNLARRRVFVPSIKISPHVTLSEKRKNDFPVDSVTTVNVLREESETISVAKDFASDTHITLAESLKKILYHEIYNLRRIMDGSFAIHSDLIRVDDKKIWLRRSDPMNLRYDYDTQDLNYNYLRLYIAYLLATITISQIYGFDDNDDFLQDVQNVYLSIYLVFSQTIRKNKISIADIELILANHKLKLIDLLTCHLPIDKKKIEKMLDQCKDWEALEDESYTVVTVINIENTIQKLAFIIMEEPCAALTKEQKILFENLENQSWFQKLEEFQQRLVIFYKDKLMANHVAPSQLRAIVPVQKNSYRQSVFIFYENNLVEVNSYYHSGTPAYLNRKIDKETAIAITKNNLKQQQENSNADESIMICLNSEFADKALELKEKVRHRTYVGDDSLIIEYTKKAASEKEGLNYAKICLNLFRLIEPDAIRGIKNIIEIVKNNIESCKYLAMDESRKNLLKTLTSLIYRTDKIKSKNKGMDKNIKGLEYIYLVTKIAYLNNILAAQHQLKTVSVWFGCASGENRTGLLEHHLITQSIYEYLGSEFLSSIGIKKPGDIALLVAKSQHIQAMTGGQGSTFGTEGIRNKSSGSIKKDYKEMGLVEYLVTLYSDMKSISLDILFYECDSDEDSKNDLRQELLTQIMQEKNRTKEFAEYFELLYQKIALETEETKTVNTLIEEWVNEVLISATLDKKDGKSVLRQCKDVLFHNNDRNDIVEGCINCDFIVNLQQNYGNMLLVNKGNAVKGKTLVSAEVDEGKEPEPLDEWEIIKVENSGQGFRN